MNNVIPFRAPRIPCKAREETQSYLNKLEGMSKMELLDEIVRFNEERDRVGALSIEMMMKGQHLFRIVADCAETLELRTKARAYCRYLSAELQAYNGAHEALGEPKS